MAEGCINTNRLPLQCPVCLDTYNRPRTLPCLHTFCTSCLHSHITNVAQGSSFSTFLCPVCRSNTRPPRPFTSKDTWSEQFPVNHWILSVIEEASTIKNDDVIYCDIHPDSKINLYCADHETVCCAVCVAVGHRKCDKVEEIAKLLNSCNNDQVRMETLNKVKQSENILTDLDAKCALADSNIQIDKDKMINLIETEYNETVHHLEALKEAAMLDVEQNCKQITNDIMTRKIICNKGKQTCKQVKDMLKDTDRNRTAFSLFVKIHTARVKMKSVDLCVANHWSFNEANSLTFESNQQFITVKQIESFGKVKDTRKPAKEQTTLLVRKGESTGKQVNMELPRTLEVTLPSNTKSSQSSTPHGCNLLQTPISRSSELQYVLYSNNPLFRKHWISGLTFLHHGLMILCNQSDKSLCLIKDNTILYVDKKPTTPWDVTKYSDNSVVVTYPQDNTVRIFEIKCNVAVMKLFRRPSIIGRPVIFQRSFSTQEACFGVVAISDRIILACEDCIKVYTINGHCTQLLKLSHRVEPLFERVVGLSLDRQRSILYATDEVRNSLFSFRLTENQLHHEPIFVYKDHILRCPRGLSVGIQGDVFVCGFVSKTIHIIRSDGTCTRILSTGQRPCGISAEQKQELMAITFYPESERRHQDASSDVRFYKFKRFISE